MATVQRKAPATTTATTTTASAKTNGGSTATITTTLAAGAIAQRAYEIWKESGCPNGRDQEHWFRAERELRSKSTLR